MSAQTKKRFNSLGKIVGIGLFTLLMLTNIKFALLDDNEISSGDISLFGIELNLFNATYGENPYQGYIRIGPCESASCPGSGWYCFQCVYAYFSTECTPSSAYCAQH